MVLSHRRIKKKGQVTDTALGAHSFHVAKPLACSKYRLRKLVFLTLLINGTQYYYAWKTVLLNVRRTFYIKVFVWGK